MDIFKIATYVGYLHCDSAVKVAFPVVQAVFLFVQVVAFLRTRTCGLYTLDMFQKPNKTCLFLDLLPLDSCKGLCAAPHKFYTVNDFLYIVENLF